MEEAAAVIEPDDAGAADPVHRRHHFLAAVRIDDMQRADLGAARGEAIRDVTPVGRGREAADRMRLARQFRYRLDVDQQPLLRARPLTPVELELVLLRATLQVHERATRVTM